MKPVRFFISFSSRDIHSAREIIAAVKYQGFEIWDYSDDLQQIEAGTQIADRLFTEIVRCDYFLAVISRNSVDPAIGRFTIRELEHALEKGMNTAGTIIPVILPGIQPDQFTGPFRELKTVKYEVFNPGEVDSLVSLVIAICFRARKEFLPYITAHPRLPFRELFTEEALSIGKQLKNTYYTELMRIISEFSGHFRQGNYPVAYLLITHFISYCRYRVPEYKLVYPFIVQAVCEMELQRADDAAESFLRALQNEPSNPDALGGMGIICLQTGRYSEAADYSSRASENSEGKQVINERLNHLFAKSFASPPLTDQETAFILNFDTEGYEEYEKNRILSCKAIFCYTRKKFPEAERFFDEIGMEKLPDAVAAIYWYLNRYELSYPPSELRRTLQFFLHSERFRSGRKHFRIYLAELHYRLGELAAFREEYQERLLAENPDDRETTIRYIRMLKNTGDRRDLELAGKECERYADRFSKSLPGSSSDFYYDGFARFLLGQLERAHYDYERSGRWDVFYGDVEKPIFK